MAVELPRIGRADVAAPASVGRMDVSVPNMTEATEPAMRGVAKGLDSVMNSYEARDNEIKKQRINVWDIKTSDLSNQFEMWSKTRIAEIAQKDGDTTADYIKYDEEAEEKRKSLFSQYGSMEPQFQQLLDNKLNTTYGKQQTFRNIQQGEQSYKYKRKVIDTTVALNTDNFFAAGQYLDVNKPDTFLGLQSYREAIVQSRIAEGDQRGTLQRDANGVPLWMDGDVGVEVRKDMGGAVIPLVKTLNATGKVKEARKLIEDYSDFLNAGDKAKLLSDSDESDVKNQAIVALTGLQSSVAAANPNNPNRRVMMGDIDKLKDISAPVKFKIIELNEIYQKRQDAESDRKTEILVNSEFEKMVKRQAGPDAYVSEAEWANSEEGKNFIAQAKPSDINNMKAMAVAPLKSKKSALDDFNEAVADRTLWKMSPREISQIYPHLNKSDRSRFDEIRRDQLYDARGKKAEGPISGDKLSGMHSRMAKALEQQMKAFRDPKSGDLLFEVNSKDKFREEYDSQMLTDYASMIREDIMEKGGKITGAQENEIVNKRLSEMVEKRKEDHKGVMSKFFGVDYKPSTRKALTPSGASAIPTSSAYGARTNITSPTTQSLTPASPLGTAPTATPSVVVSPSTGTVTNLPGDSDRKAWIRLWEESTGQKFDFKRDMNSYKSFKEATKKKGR